VVHGNVRTKILDAHCHLTKPVDEASQRLSLFLVNANQGDEGQVVWPAGGELGLKLGYECCEAIDGVGREFGEPTKGSFLQERGEHSAQHCVVRRVEVHMSDICIHMLVRVSCSIVPILIEAFPLLRQWNFCDEVGEGVLANRIKGDSRLDLLVETGFTIHLMGESLIHGLLNRSRVGRGGE